MIKTLADLNAKKEEALEKMTKTEDGTEITRVVVGLATCGIAAGANPVFKAFADGVKKSGLKNVTVNQTGCIGMCQFEPIVEITVPGQAKITYVQMTQEKALKVIKEHLLEGKPVAEYTVGSVTE